MGLRTGLKGGDERRERNKWVDDEKGGIGTEEGGDERKE